MTTKGIGPRDLARTIADRIPRHDGKSGRLLIAISGPPASGKSTVAEQLVIELKERGRAVALAGMDGFHLDNSILRDRELLSRKGAPETFDLDGFVHAMRRLTRGEDVVLPTFDRSLDLSIAGSAHIGSDIDTVVVEGNYLTFDEPGWRELADLWDISVFLAVEEQTLEARLIERWLVHGLALEEARDRARQNDIPNAQRILAHRLPVDHTLSADG